MKAGANIEEKDDDGMYEYRKIRCLALNSRKARNIGKTYGASAHHWERYGFESWPKHCSVQH